MAYDLNSSYQPPPRAYLAQRAPQSPRAAYQQPVYTQEPEQYGYNDDHVRSGNGSHDQRRVNGGGGGPRAPNDPRANHGHDRGQPHQPTQSQEGESARGRSDRGEARRREASRAASRTGARKPFVEAMAPDAMPLSQDNAFPTFPTKRQAQKEAKAREDHARSRPSTSNGQKTRNAPGRSRSATANSAQRPPSPRPQQDARPAAHANERASPREQRDPYRSPPRKPAPQLAPLPTFSPPFSQSSRPSTSDSANGRERPFLAPLDTHAMGQPHLVESPLLSTVTARHHPAIIGHSHSPLEARISQSAHLSQASYNGELALPQKPWNNPPSKHQSLGEVYDDYYSAQAAPVDREAQIEAEMPDFDKPTAHKRQPTIDEHLDNLLHLDQPSPAPQPQSTYQTASSKLKAAKSQPNMRQQTPVRDGMDDFDFGFGGQPLSRSPDAQFGQYLPPRPEQAQAYNQQPPMMQQRSASYDNQTPAPARVPMPQHSYSYDDRGTPPNMHPQTRQRAPDQYGQTPMSRKPAMGQQHDMGYDGQGHMPLAPPQSQQRSFSYDDPRPPPQRPMPQQRALTYDDQDPYARQPFNEQSPLPHGRPMPNGPASRRPLPNGDMAASAPGAPMPRGPPSRGPMLPGQMPPGASSRRGPMPPGRPMPNGHGPMNGGSAPRGPPGQSRRPPPPGQVDHRAAPGMQTTTVDGRAPTQRHAPDNRAPSAPATQGGFAPPPSRQADYGYGPGPNHMPMDVRAPSAPPTQNGFAPPSSRQADYGYGPGPNHMPTDVRAPTAPPTQNGFAPPPRQADYGYGPGPNHMPMDVRAPSAPPTQNGFAPPSRQADYGYGPGSNRVPMDGRAPMSRYAPDNRAPSAPVAQGHFAPPPPPDRPFDAPLTQQRSAPQTVPGAQQSNMPVSINPDALPSHPVPVRPGLNEPAAAPAPKPAPVRHYAGNPDLPSNPQPQSNKHRPSVDETADSGPVTKAELEALRVKADANPNDNKTALLLAKKLVEAATVLASENGRLDAKMTAKNSERYVLEAHKRVKKLVAANYPEAMFYLADCYGSGELGLETDPKQAFSLYQSAAKAGHGGAAYRTAMCCELGPDEGGGTKRDYHKAVQWYQRAAQLNDVPAMFKMGMILVRGLLGQQRNVGQAVVYLKRAAEQADADNPHALHELARLHEEGNPDPAISAAVKPDERYSQKLYMQAAKMGFKASQNRLGQAFEYGSLGLPVDSRNSIAWYSKAAAQGEHNAELALSGWYLTGAEGILGQSDTEAYLWARKAALSEPPLAKAMYALGYYVENGIGCPSSVEEAKRWYSRAASYKFPKAIERLEEIRKGKAGRPQPNAGRLTRSNQKRDEAECIVM